jgi:spore germination protein GerM
VNGIARRRCGLWILASLSLCTIGLTGCGIDDDAAPQRITEVNRPNLTSTESETAGPTSGTDRIYLLAPESPNDVQRLRPVTRDVGDSATQRLQSLFGLLTVVEVNARLRTAVPDGLALHSAVLQTSGTLTVDVSDQLLDLTSTNLVDAVAQIVFTASEVRDVQRVDLLVDGEARQWPAGDGELQTGALTVYDYPGFIESTQPAFPAVPSPEA